MGREASAVPGASRRIAVCRTAPRLECGAASRSGRDGLGCLVWKPVSGLQKARDDQRFVHTALVDGNRLQKAVPHEAVSAHADRIGEFIRGQVICHSILPGDVNAPKTTTTRGQMACGSLTAAHVEMGGSPSDHLARVHIETLRPSSDAGDEMAIAGTSKCTHDGLLSAGFTSGCGAAW